MVTRIYIIKTCFDIVDLIVFMHINSKFYYNRKYEPMIFIVRNYTLLQLYKSYSISFILN